MGAHYGNITIKGATKQDALQALHGRRAILTETIDDYTVVFDSVCDELNLDKVQSLTLELSKILQKITLSVSVLDDDVLVYFLCRNGELIDSYNSFPSYLDFGTKQNPDVPMGGDAKKLCDLFQVNSYRKVENILRKSHNKSGYSLETLRHGDLVRALSLPRFAIGTAMANFDRGEYPEGLSEHQITKAANPPPVEDREQRRDRDFYERLGPEDTAKPCKHEGCGRGSVQYSTMCKRHHFEMIKQRDCPFYH